MGNVDYAPARRDRVQIAQQAHATVVTMPVSAAAQLQQPAQASVPAIGLKLLLCALGAEYVAEERVLLRLRYSQARPAARALWSSPPRSRRWCWLPPPRDSQLRLLLARGLTAAAQPPPASFGGAAAAAAQAVNPVRFVSTVAAAQRRWRGGGRPRDTHAEHLRTRRAVRRL